MKEFVTARTYPLEADGRFASEVAEFVYQEAVALSLGLTREQVRHLLQAFNECSRKSDTKYESTTGRCTRCHQNLPQLSVGAGI